MEKAVSSHRTPKTRIFTIPSSPTHRGSYLTPRPLATNLSTRFPPGLDRKRHVFDRMSASSLRRLSSALAITGFLLFIGLSLLVLARGPRPVRVGSTPTTKSLEKENAMPALQGS